MHCLNLVGGTLAGERLWLQRCGPTWPIYGR